MDSSSPLAGLAMNYIIEACPSSSEDEQNAALAVLKQRMNGDISSEETITKCSQILGSAAPAERINSIMGVSKTPIAYQYSSNANDFGLTSRQKARNWSSYEDQRLLAGILRYGLDNWPSIAEFVGNGRNRSQCSQRWNRGLNPSIYKGPWTKQEEADLVRLVKEYGEKSWKRIATFLGNRSDVQCRYHYQQMQKSDNLGVTVIESAKSESSEAGTPPEGVKKQEDENSFNITDSMFDFKTNNDFWSVNLFDRIDTFGSIFSLD